MPQGAVDLSIRDKPVRFAGEAPLPENCGGARHRVSPLLEGYRFGAWRRNLIQRCRIPLQPPTVYYQYGLCKVLGAAYQSVLSFIGSAMSGQLPRQPARCAGGELPETVTAHAQHLNVELSVGT